MFLKAFVSVKRMGAVLPTSLPGIFFWAIFLGNF